MKTLYIVSLAAVRAVPRGQPNLKGVGGGHATGPVLCEPEALSAEAFVRSQHLYPLGKWTEQKTVSAAVPEAFIREAVAALDAGETVPKVWGVAVMGLRKCNPRKGLGGVTVECYGGPIWADTEDLLAEYADGMTRTQFPEAGYPVRQAAWAYVTEDLLREAHAAIVARDNPPAEEPAKPKAKKPRKKAAAKPKAQAEGDKEKSP